MKVNIVHVHSIFKKVSKIYQNATKNVDLRRLMTKDDSYAIFLTLMSKYAHFVAYVRLCAQTPVCCVDDFFFISQAVSSKGLLTFCYCK